MRVNGKMEKKMDLVLYFGVINQNLWDYLKMIKFQDMENYGMMMWMYIKDIGKNFKLRELGNTKQKREHFLKVNGSKIDKMDLE